MQTSDISRIISKALKLTQQDSGVPYTIVNSFDSEIDTLIANYPFNEKEISSNFFSDVSEQVVDDLTHHLSRASTNYIDYTEYSTEDQLYLAASMMGHVLHDRDVQNNYFKANYENLSEILAPDYKEDLHGHNYTTFGGALHDIKHNPGILNTLHYTHKSHSNMHNELLHRHHSASDKSYGGSLSLKKLKHLHHADQINSAYQNKNFKNDHMRLNKITTPIYSNHTFPRDYNITNHHEAMHQAREQGDYKTREFLHEHFINLHQL